MATLVIPTGRVGYAGVLHHVLTTGVKRKSRGMSTLDAGHTTIEIQSPYNALPVGVGRNLSRRIAAVEAVQLIGKFTDPQLLVTASPNFKRYQEEDGTFWGAYGERIGAQLQDVQRKLIKDIGTRQAVISLWDPALDNLPLKRDYPCTLSLVFSANPRMGALELDVTMRSNDAWRGFPYDIFQFTQLQLTLARAVGMEPGAYRHHAHSLHLYLEDVPDAHNVAYRTEPPKFVEELPTGFNCSVGDVALAMTTAHHIAYDVAPFLTPMELNDSESWYWHTLRGHAPELTRATL